MRYFIRKRPSGQVLCERATEKEAIRLISEFESIDIEQDAYEPDTYYFTEEADR